MLRDRAEEWAGPAHAVSGWLARYLPPRTLRQYQDLGYVLLAGPVLLALWLARRASFAMQDLLQDLPHWQAVVLQALVKKIPVPWDIAGGLSLVKLLAICYALLWLRSRPRRAIGGAFADGISWLAVRAVQLAGWCLDHRWYSLLLIGLLVFNTGFTIRSWANDRREEGKVEVRFAQWLDQAEHLLTQSALDGSATEAASFAAVAGAWDDDFARALSMRELKAARCLRDLIRDLFAGYRPSGSLIDYLVPRRAGLVEVYEKALGGSAGSTPAAASVQLDRIAGLSRLLLAKVHVRLSLDDCSDISMVLEANDFLSGTGAIPQPLIANLRGNVYNCLSDALLREAAAPGVLGGDYGRVHSLCASPGICLDRSLAEYQKARGEERCSFAWQRWLNNDLDVKLRLALRFEGLDPAALGASAGQPWLKSRAAFAGEIERRAHELLACNPTAPLFFVTAAQAYGAASGLRAAGSDEQADDLRAAGAFLRLAHSYRPGDLGQWNLSFFCPALNGDSYREDFLLGLGALAGLPRLDADVLRNRIRPRCR